MYTLLTAMVILSISFTLYVLIEKPGMHFSEQLRKKLQKYLGPQISTPSRDIPLPEKEFDPEKTEPRQPVALVETSTH